MLSVFKGSMAYGWCWLGDATASVNPALVVSLGCELLLQLLTGSSGAPNALFSRVHVDPFLGRQCCVLERGFNPFFACWWRYMQDVWMLFSDDRFKWIPCSWKAFILFSLLHQLSLACKACPLLPPSSASAKLSPDASGRVICSFWQCNSSKSEH